MTEPEVWLTVAEAVERLRSKGLTISDESLRRWARAGQINAIKLPSGQLRYSTTSIDEMVETPAEVTQ